MNQKRKAGRPRKYPRESLVSIGYDFLKRQSRNPELRQKDYAKSLGVSDRYIRHAIRAHKEAEAKALARQSYPQLANQAPSEGHPGSVIDSQIELEAVAKPPGSLFIGDPGATPEPENGAATGEVQWRWT